MIKITPWYKNKKILVSFVGVFIIFMMVLSTLSIWKTDETTNQLKYKNHVFNKQGDQWVSYFNDKPVAFFYNPLELENLTMPSFTFFDKTYLAYDQHDIETESFVIQRAFSILQYSNIRPVLACYSEENCPDIPIINCTNDNSLYIKYSNDTNIYIEDKCLVLEGTQDYQLKYLDKIFYNLLGI